MALAKEGQLLQAEQFDACSGEVQYYITGSRSPSYPKLVYKQKIEIVVALLSLFKSIPRQIYYKEPLKKH